ncbi:MAG TPA: hypothetical protein VMT36_06940 [Candidatus Saccharimonadia bacterium]|nr:hypothetical protein [Candidatus Saccharimonadia bacterium]
MTTAARPQGVTIIAILAFIGGIFAIVAGLGLTVLGGILGGALAASGEAAGGALGGFFAVLGIGILGLGIAQIVIGWGLWGLKPWAWMVSVIVFIASIVVTLLFALAGNSLISISTLAGIAIPAIILYYLMTPPVKAVFGRP